VREDCAQLWQVFDWLERLHVHARARMLCLTPFPAGHYHRAAVFHEVRCTYLPLTP
jgi:hypothetical protein